MLRRPALALIVTWALGLVCVPGSHAETYRPFEPDAALTARNALQKWQNQAMAEWQQVYRDLHAHPELSLQETRTAALVEAALKHAGYTVTPGVGGTGVVGLLDNGPGPTLMLRGDMDALPVSEETNLSYASQVRTSNGQGQEVGVMHACGHDVHVTNLLATATFLAEYRNLWTGTLLIVAQPAEELGQGAADMIAAGLFKRFARPDYAVALHVAPDLPSNQVGYTSGWAFANVDSVDITLFGRGGHGARPHQAIDPIVAGAHLVTTLQTLVSRRLDPQEAAVVTVGTFHAGSKHNIIPDEAHLGLTVRSYSDATRTALLEGIQQLAQDVCTSFKCPKPPRVQVKANHTPALYNDPGLAAHAEQVFQQALGERNVVQIQPTMGGEDFARYGRALKIPTLMFRVGTVAPGRLKRSQRTGQALPSLHSSRFAPDADNTLRTAVKALSQLALSLLGPAPSP